MMQPGFVIPADHPALAGHFEGDPIVPASLILDQVLAASPHPPRALVFAKFLRPLRPGEPIRLTYRPTPDGHALDFQCHHEAHLICTGRLNLPEP